MHVARLLAISTIAAAVLAAPLPAQPPAPKPAPADPTIARALTRAALIDLRAVAAPGPADFRIAATLLRDATALAPGDLDILHLAIDAARQSGDQAGTLDLIKRLCAADPQDTVAQLDLIDALAATKNKVEDRIAMCDQILGAKGVDIDPAVRSRVALRAALLLRELGAEDSFKQHLTAAVQLDSSNTAAAALAYEVFAKSGGAASGRIELLVNLLNANPLDPGTHLALAREFASAGAHEAALRFYEDARLLANRIGTTLPIDDQADRLVQTWKKLGAATAVKELNDAIFNARRNAEVDRALAEGRHDPLNNLPKPENLRLPIAMERIRFAAAVAVGDKETVAKSVPDFEASLDAERARVATLISKLEAEKARTPVEAANYPEILAAAQNAARQAEMLKTVDYELAFIRGWSGVAPVQFRDTLDRLRADKATPPDVLARLDAWAKYRAGDAAGARADFAAMKDDGLARLAIAQIDLDSPNPPADLGEALARLAVDVPSSPISAWAISVHTKLRAGPPPLPEAAQRFTAMAAGIPAWVDTLARDPWHDVSVVAITSSPNLGPLDPAIITLKIRNDARVPLAFGPNRDPAKFENPISSEFLIMTAVDANGVKLPALGGSEPTTMWRRLRIMPRQEVSISFWADPGLTGWCAESALTATLRTRWHLVQGFRIIDGSPVPGMLGSSFDVGPIFRAGVGPTDLNALVAQIGSAREGDLARAVLAARQALLSVDALKGLSDADAHTLLSALVQRYKKESRIGRLAILLFTPGPRLSPVTAELDRALAETPETDPLVARAALLTRAEDPASPLIAAAQKSADADLHAYADSFAKRLATPVNTFARLKTTSTIELTGGKLPGPAVPTAAPAPGADTPAPETPAPVVPAPTPPGK